jgi:hypothetical protein
MPDAIMSVTWQFQQGTLEKVRMVQGCTNCGWTGSTDLVLTEYEASGTVPTACPSCGYGGISTEPRFITSGGASTLTFNERATTPA